MSVSAQGNGAAGVAGGPALLRLVTIPISHYCEKARWALDRRGLSYREEFHVQGIHRVAARRAGAGPTVPVLVTPEGVIGESELILRWVDARTEPSERLFGGAAQELALCRRFDAELGPRGRRLMYVHMLAQRELALEYNNQGVARWEDRLVRWGWSSISSFLRRELEITPGIEREDEALVFAELDHVAALLADGREYLCGERFGAADLTFAALSASLLLPPEYGVRLPQPELLAPDTAALVRRAREHPAGAYALELFARHRRAPLASVSSADRLGG
ncbi:MAG TPA: glutathione S-transferase N-terminal domain-containing protein [Solirubrobacteraceae bacterium]|nr:glutathione S-transferase N-terminal domain-containing protein [Solirubrobacteraceae bacterium]